MEVRIDVRSKLEELGDLYGIFFEDLNHAADGGLYGELVQNRAFEFDPVDNSSYDHLYGWEVLGGTDQIEAKILTGNPVNGNNPHYLVLDVHEPGQNLGIQNAGFHSGMAFGKNAGYDFSCWAKREQDLGQGLTISLQDDKGTVLAEKSLTLSTEWQKYELSMETAEAAQKGRLVMTVSGRGKIYLDFVSLFPKDTFRGKKGGLRRDLAELLENLHPKFLRFPGGCLTHDGALDPDARDAAYRWKNTLGPVEGRPARRNNWGYNQTLGLGFYELFELCEAIGAKPLPVISPGYDPHHHREAPLDHMQYFIDEALDLIEFANGDVGTKWGAIRAEMGHPQPFGMEYLAIGNEEVGEPFFHRYRLVAKAVKERYPDMKLIGTSGPNAAGSEYERGWRHAKEGLTDIVDEHYYQSPEWFVANHDRYAAYDGKPGVFVGEYASWGNTWRNALCEAAYMVGFEKHARAVKLACYAPLLCSADHVNWRPDMIWFDAARCFGTANYYVQKLFMENQGIHTLRLDKAGFPAAECMTRHPHRINGRIALGNYESKVAYRDILLRNEDTGEEYRFDPQTIENEEKVSLPINTEWENYSLRLKGKELQGRRGFRIYFGIQDEKSLFCWTIGGWQNQDTFITETINGVNSDLSQCLKTVEPGVEYELELKVSGRRIRTYIDGAQYHDIQSSPIMVEPLYISSSRDANGDIIVKAVNLSKQDRPTELVFEGLDGGSHSVKAHVMSGFEPEDENSFDEPEKVTPHTLSAKFDGNGLSWNFAAESINVLRITDNHSEEPA